MSVSNYKNSKCDYNIDKLEKVVYLINEHALKDIHIDEGEAYVTDVGQTPMALTVYNIQLSDTDELDERYKFTHTLTFSMKGYANYRDFEGRYYAIVKTVDGKYWLVNPMFPCKVTYTYTLDSSDSHTDFTMATISNHPTLRIHGMNHATPYECGYKRCTFGTLRLNESASSLLTNSHVLYTNDGFKDIEFNKNSAVFTETFDGKNIQHKIDFNIKFDDYKSSWHYNLLEFTENRYAAIIETSCNKFILVGFHFGLQPSFTVTANDEMAMDNILISLSDNHDNGTFISYLDDITIENDGSKQWVFTNKFNGYECIGNNLARYLLKEEVDALMNPTGNYMVLIGYESQFPFLDIVGTFTDTETFNSYDCYDNCRMQSSFPLEFVFNNETCRDYDVICDSDWFITSSAEHITVSPSSGVANQAYTVQICNELTPSVADVNSILTVNYCNKQKTYNVVVKQSDECLQAGEVFDISANGQYVTIPTSCCVSDVLDNGGTITNITIQNTYIRVYIPQNNDGEARQFVLTVTYCNGTEGEININQGTGFERWVKENTICIGNQKCDVERKYTGATIDDINTRTEETRNTNCASSTDCSGVATRWLDTSKTTCSGGKRYTIQKEQKTVDGGETWTDTGNERLGGEVEDPNNECAGVEEYEEWRENGTVCNGTTKYNRQQLYVSTDQEHWVATNVYRIGNSVIETNSTDCGYVIPSTGWTWEDWRVVESDFVCDDGNKYERLRRYVSNDQVSSKEQVTNWTPTNVYKKGEIIDEDSGDCGYDLMITGNCSEYRDESDTTCDGFDKYKYLRKYVRNCNDCENCDAAWQQTDIYKIGNKIQEHSIDCGYVPSDDYYEWREAGWDCNVYDKYKKYRKYISEDGNNWYETNIYKLGDSPIETNSTDCGYVDRIQYEYRWIESDATKCVGTTKYYQYKKQRRRTNLGSQWEDVVPTVYSIDADGTMEALVAEVDSEDCGYVPPIEAIYKWVTMDINNYWVCANCEDTPDEQPKIEYRLNESGATVQSAACNSNTTLVSSDYGNQDIAYAKIGGCIKTIGENAFQGKTNLTEVLVPSTVTTIGAGAFSGCTSLVDFSLPIYVSSIGANAFNGDIQLNKIMLPNNLTSLGNAAFKGCKNFATINIPEEITIIPTECFYDCDGMTDIYLSENVRVIQSKAFGECNGLVNFTCYATEPPTIYSDTFINMNENLKIYVPSAAVNAYKTAWSTYADKIVAIG